MRSEVYFLPPRTSVTDSVGISTLPILSCNPKACTRDSSDSLTLRSNPEYAWMMYHFIFGLRGGSPPGTTSAGGGGGGCWPPWPASALSFFSLSVSGIKSLLSLARLMAREIMQTPLQAVADREIN